MQVILLERIDRLGFIGDVVSVKSGFARNFLLPKGKALRANEQNLEYFKSRRAEIEANNLKLKNDAEKVAEKVKDLSLVIVRQASESGMLFGSVRPGDIVEAAAANGVTLAKKQILIKNPIRSVGNHQVIVRLHPEVDVDIRVRIMTAQEQGTQMLEAGEEVVDSGDSE